MVTLITHATLTNWSPRQLIPDMALAFQDDTIIAIGSMRELITQFPQAEQLDAGGKLLLPGNICAHTHFYGAFARGMAIAGPAPRNFPEILARLWWPLDKSLTLNDVRLSALVCLVDAIKHGTTTLIDHHASPNAIEGSLGQIAEAVDHAGLRAVLCYEVTDRDGMDKAHTGIAENIRFMRANRQRDRIRGTFGLHASLTLSDETLAACVEAAAQVDAGFHIHVAEHEADEEDSLRRSGQRVVQRLQQAGILGPRTIVAHGVHIDDQEMDILRDTQTWITHQPRSNMNNAVGAARIDTMLERGIRVCLGNDGFSNNMFAEWKTAYLLHKVATRDPRAMNGETVVKMATTHNTALVQQFFPEKTVGTLAVGAAADMMVLDYQPFTPLTGGNLPWHVLFGVEASMVTATICGGKVLMWDRVLRTLDEAAIMAEARQAVPAVWERYNTFAAAAL